MRLSARGLRGVLLFGLMAVGQQVRAQAAPPGQQSSAPPPEPEALPGARIQERMADDSPLAPGAGFKFVQKPYAEMSVGAYVLLRYLDQLPADQTFSDHLGNTSSVHARQDIQLQRALVSLHGFVFSEKFRYDLLFWFVNAGNPLALTGSLGYRFHPAFHLFAGISANPGDRSMLGAFPYFFGTERQLADEYFRPGFTAGVWVTGHAFDMLGYKVMVGDDLSQIYVTAPKSTRHFAGSCSLWIMPTTGEFGPRGGFGDYEMHERVATRFGVSFTHSRESRADQLGNRTPENVPIRLSDSLLLFQTGALAPKVTVTRADYDMLAIDAGVKYRGLHIQGEYYQRWLSQLRADGPLPLARMYDTGFYLQVGYQLWPKHLEGYVVSSQIFGQFNDSYEAGGGVNMWPFSTRNVRLNAMATYVHRSPVGSLYSYYAGGQDGPVISVATDLFF